MKRKMTGIVAAFLAVSLLLAGCGSSKEESAYSNDYYYDPSYDAAGEAESLKEAGIELGSDASLPAAAEDTAQAELERKIIKNAWINMEADDAKQCYDSVLAYAKELGGYESSCSMDKYDYSTESTISIHATLRLPPDKLDAFMAKTGDFGAVRSSNVDQDEITEQYYDLTTRLASKEHALESYYTLLAKAQTVDEIIQIQTRIDNLTEDIESIKGKLRVYDSKVSESTVNLEITQRTKAPIAQKDFEWDSLDFKSFCKLIKNGFLGVCNFVWSALLWILIIVISVLPLLLIAGAVLLIVKKFRKKHPKEEKENKNKKNEVVLPPSYLPEKKEEKTEEK